MNLKEALSKNKLRQFIKERESETGDKSQFDSAISSMVSGKSPKARGASKKDSSES